ncbi:hypothetical protein D3C86_1652560 [compost metagenome]
MHRQADQHGPVQRIVTGIAGLAYRRCRAHFKQGRHKAAHSDLDGAAHLGHAFTVSDMRHFASDDPPRHLPYRFTLTIEHIDGRAVLDQ